MAVRLRRLLNAGLDDLRYEPTARRVRAEAGGVPVLDSTRAVLVWEPRRVVPSYAVPEADVHVPLETPGGGGNAGDWEALGLALPEVSDRPILDPSVPFAVHTAPGEVVALAVDGRPVPAYRLADPPLTGHVLVDFDGVDTWREEDERVVAHPRDPFHRVDALPSSRHVRLELDGTLLAESSRPVLLFETSLPVRFYLPREDVVAELRPSATRSWCAYKGEASYWSVRVGAAGAGGEWVDDLVWGYPDPLREAEPVRDRFCFFDERVDVVLDGERRPRPVTPWSSR